MEEKYSYPNTYIWNEAVNNILESSFFQNLPIDKHSIESLILNAEKAEEVLAKIFSKENMNKLISIYKLHLDTIYQKFDEKVKEFSKEYLDINVFKEIPKENLHPLAIKLGASLEKKFSGEFLSSESGEPYKPNSTYMPEKLIFSMALEESLFEGERKIAVLKRRRVNFEIKNIRSYCQNIPCQEKTLEQMKRFELSRIKNRSRVRIAKAIATDSEYTNKLQKKKI